MSPWYIVKFEEISHIFDLATPDIFKMDRHDKNFAAIAGRCLKCV